MHTDISRRPRRGTSTDSRSRTERRDRASRQRRFIVIPLVAALAIGLVVAGLAFALTHVGRPATPVGPAAAAETPLPDKTLSASDGSLTAETTALATASATASVEIEVPDVVGRSVAAAEALLQAAGFKTQTRVADGLIPGVAADEVVSQWPNAGARLHAGERVVVTYQPAGTGGSRFVVVIDPGHQAKADLGLEPIGPGSTEMKTKVAGGATGVATKIEEYKQVLAISLKLRERLQAAGVRVIMVRTSNDVNISNKQRALIGNTAGADLVVRVHLDSAASSAAKGVSTLFPSGNSWCKPIEASSKQAAGMVEDAVTAATGATRRGVIGRADMTGFNWSTRPTIIVECGFMSNPDEDRRCADSTYQDKIASGISSGVLAYLNHD